MTLEREEIQSVGAKKLVKKAAEAQQQQLLDTLKAIHGVFMNTSMKDTRDFKLTHKWLKRGKQRAETEALVIAAQDGVIMTRAYQSRVLKKSVNPMCRKCHGWPETIGHILSCCPVHQWTLYKDKHNQVLGTLYYHLCKVLGLKALKPWEPIPAVQENDRARLLWDASIPTDRMLEHRRPDITLVLKKSKKILLLEMACAYV